MNVYHVSGCRHAWLADWRNQFDEYILWTLNDSVEVNRLNQMEIELDAGTLGKVEQSMCLFN